MNLIYNSRKDIKDFNHLNLREKLNVASNLFILKSIIVNRWKSELIFDDNVLMSAPNTKHIVLLLCFERINSTLQSTCTIFVYVIVFFARHVYDQKNTFYEHLSVDNPISVKWCLYVWLHLCNNRNVYIAISFNWDNLKAKTNQHISESKYHSMCMLLIIMVTKDVHLSEMKTFFNNVIQIIIK